MNISYRNIQIDKIHYSPHLNYHVNSMWTLLIWEVKVSQDIQWEAELAQTTFLWAVFPFPSQGRMLKFTHRVRKEAPRILKYVLHIWQPQRDQNPWATVRKGTSSQFRCTSNRQNKNSICIMRNPIQSRELLAVTAMDTRGGNHWNLLYGIWKRSELWTEIIMLEIMAATHNVWWNKIQGRVTRPSIWRLSLLFRNRNIFMLNFPAPQGNKIKQPSWFTVEPIY